MSNDYNLDSRYNFDVVVVPADGVDEATFSGLVEKFNDLYEDGDGYPYLPMTEHGVVADTNNTHTTLHDQGFQDNLGWGHVPDVPNTSTGEPIRLTGDFMGARVPNWTFYFSGLFNEEAPDHKTNPDTNPVGARDALKEKISALGIRVVETGEIVDMSSSGRTQHVSALSIAPA